MQESGLKVVMPFFDGSSFILHPSSFILCCLPSAMQPEPLLRTAPYLPLEPGRNLLHDQRFVALGAAGQTLEVHFLKRNVILAKPIQNR